MSKQINDGGPAFPPHAGAIKPEYMGMPLRDYFAGQAMQGALAGDEQQCGGYGSAARLARAAYEIADAMLAEREKGAADE